MSSASNESRAKLTQKRSRIQQANERKILDAGLEVFSAYGYRGGTIDRIAALAGISKPNLLYYFRHKEDIYYAVLHRTLSVVLEPLAMLDPDGDPETEIKAYILRKLDVARKDPKASQLVGTEILQGATVLRKALQSQPLRQVLEDKALLIARWQAEGRLAPVDPFHLIFIIWAATHFEMQIRGVFGGEDEEAFFENARNTLEQVFMNGIRPAP